MHAQPMQGVWCGLDMRARVSPLLGATRGAMGCLTRGSPLGKPLHCKGVLQGGASRSTQICPRAHE